MTVSTAARQPAQVQDDNLTDRADSASATALTPADSIAAMSIVITLPIVQLYRNQRVVWIGGHGTILEVGLNAAPLNVLKLRRWSTFNPVAQHCATKNSQHGCCRSTRAATHGITHRTTGNGAHDSTGA